MAIKRKNMNSISTIDMNNALHALLNEYMIECGWAGMTKLDFAKNASEIGGFSCAADYGRGLNMRFINTKVLPLEAIANYIGCPISLLQEGYDFTLGEYVSKALDSRDVLELKFSSSDSAYKAFHNELVDCIKRLNEKQDMKSLGKFCREAGLSKSTFKCVNFRNAHLRDGILVASRNLYGSGTGASAKRLQSFRQEWNSLFSAVKPDCKKDFSVKF